MNADDSNVIWVDFRKETIEELRKIIKHHGPIGAVELLVSRGVRRSFASVMARKLAPRVGW